MALLVCVWQALASPTSAAVPAAVSVREAVEPASLVGDYRLEGAEGVVSALSLDADGRFRWRLHFADLEQRARGCWEQRPGEVVLVPDRPAAGSTLAAHAGTEADTASSPTPAFEVMVLAVEGDGLVSPQIGGRYVRVRP
jgi:hypothetical protein